MAEQSPKAEPTQLTDLVAASAVGAPDIDSLLDTFKSNLQSRPRVLKPGQDPAGGDLTAPAYLRCNAAARDDFKEAALDRGLSSPLFGALRLAWSAPAQGVLCIPEANYVKEDPALAQVFWSADGRKMRVDLGFFLVPRGWGTPVGFIRHANIYFYKEHPKMGSILLLHLKDSTLRDGPTRLGKQEVRKQEKEGGASPGPGQP